MATMEEMRMDLDTMKEFIMKQGDEIVRLKKMGNIEEDNCSLESESILSQRLYDIEFQLSEQKRSTTKITKLCMAAIKALEKLEQKPGGLEIAAMDDCSITSKDSDSSVDPMMIKTLCEQMDVINKLLIKVDDDIEAVDQKAEDGLSDCEKITEKIKAVEKSNKERCDTLLGEMRAMLVSKTYATREDLSRSIKTIPIPISKDEIAQMIQHAKDDISKSIKTIPIPMKKEEVTQMIQHAKEDISKTCATREDLSRSLKTIPAPLKKEEVSQMIDRATSNFLRTVHAETANCVEKTQDCEEFVKTEMKKLKTSVDETDNFVRNEARQIQENTEKNMKEVTRTLANLVEQQQTKANSQNVDAYERLNKRLDTEIKNFGDMMKDMPKEDNKPMDESKFNARMERLGKEISLMKSKQTELSQSFDNSLSKQTFLETQNTNIARTLERHQDEVQKVTMVERNVEELSQKIEANSKLYEQSVEESLKKIDRAEMDDLRNGMEKERCKINYFQDKISNIAKSVEGVKIENNNMRDKFCSDIEGHDGNIKSLEKLVEKQSTQISENSTALKGITLDSIGKIKDVANNCVQVEMNIRSIRDKSILFDNDLKQIKDQISQMKYENGNNQQQQQQTFEREVMKLINKKDEEVNAVNEGIQSIKKKVHQNTSDLNNFKEDKRTKEGENEERQSSLEQNLLDVRSYVETMLNETNKQLTSIAVEVENANLKISKCASDIGEVFHKHADHTGDFTFVIKSLEEKMNDLQEFGNIKQGEFLEKILELRSSFVDSQSEFVNKLQLSNESIGKLRDESSLKIDKLESQMKKNFDANNVIMNKTNQSINEIKTKSNPEINDIIGKLDAFKADHERTKADVKKCIEEGRDSTTKVKADIVCLQKTEESQQSTLKNVAENLAKIDKEVKQKVKEDNDKVNGFKSDIEKSHKLGENLKKELDNRLEILRKGLVEMIGLNELKTSEIDVNLKQTNDVVNDIKVVQNNIQMNIENKLKATKDNFESVIIDSMKTKSLTSPEMESKFAALKKDVEHVKNELKIGDLESFKSVVNHTTETHNKLISSMQKNVDLIICEKTILESQTAVLDSKVSDILSEKDSYESSLRDSIQKESDESEKIKEQVSNLQLNMRDIHDKIEAYSKLDSNLKNLTRNIQEAKSDFTNKVQENASQMTNLEELLNCELEKLKTSASSTTKLDSDLKFLKNLTSNLQEAKNELTIKVQENTSKMQDLEEMLNCELKNLKTSVTSNGKSLQDKFMGEFREVTKNIQEKSSLADTQLNEALEMIHNHTRVIDTLSDSVGQVNKTSESSDSQIQKLELKLTSCIDELSKLDQFVTSADLKKVERSINEKSDKYDSNEVDNKITALKQDVSESIKGISNKNNSLEQMLRELQSNFNSETDMSSLPDEVQMLSSKVNQQKAKLIDMEANITMQERSTSKLSDDVKKLNGSVSGSINKLEDKLEKLNKHGVVNEDTSSKMSNSTKQNGLNNDELHELAEIKSRFDAKSSTWDRKAESSEIDKLNIVITDEVNKIQKEIKDILKNSEVMKLQLEQTKEDGNQTKLSKKLEDTFIKKNEFKALDLDFSKLSDHVQKTISGNIAKIEQKLLNFETSKKDTSTKMVELSNNDEKVFKELVTLSSLKSKFESKANSWDNKVDSAEIKKLDTLVNDEVKKLKKDIQNIQENNAEIKDNLKTNSKNGDQETISKSLENKFVSKDELNAMDTSIAKLSTEVKKSNESMAGNISKCEKRLADFDTFKKDTSTKLVELTKKNDKLNGDIVSFSGLKSKFDSKCNIWDKKAETEDVKKIESLVSEEVKKIKKDIDNINEKNGEMQNNFKKTSDENQATISKTLENKLTENIKEIENKMSNYETCSKDIAANVSDILKKNEKLNENLTSLSTLKSQFDSKVSTWDSKANPEEVNKLDTFVNEEVKKMKKDIEYILEKNDEIHANLKTASQTETQEIVSKNLENKLTGNIANVENKIAKFEISKNEIAATVSDLSTKLEKMKNEIGNLSGLKSTFDSKENVWDNKVDPKELKKLDTFVNEEVSKIKNDIENLCEKNNEINSNLKTASQNENQEITSKALENKLTSNIAQVENKIAIFENSRQEVSKKISELSTKFDELDKDFVNLSGLKSTIDSKVNIWDNKADPEEVKKMDAFVNEEVKKLKENIEFILEKNDELSNSIKSNAQNENQEVLSKNLETKLTGNMAQMENKLAIFEKSRQDLTTKMSEILKKNEKIDLDLFNLSGLQTKFDSKITTWDSKADQEEIKKLDTFINEEVKKIKKDIVFILEKNDEINANLKASSQNENQETTPKDLENRLTGNLAQIENKIAILESSRKDLSTKLSELLTKNEKITEDLTKVSELKSTFDSKVNMWDSKADPAEIKKLDTFVNEEVKKIKMDIENITKKNDETSFNTLDNKYISKDKFKDLETNVNQISENIKTNNANNSNSNHVGHLEEKISKLETSSGDFKNKFSSLMEKNSQINEEIVALSGLKSKFDAKAKFWDSKVDTSEIQNINTILSDEVNKLQKNIDSISDKTDEVHKNLKNSKQDENLETSMKDLKGNFISKAEFTVLEKSNKTLLDDVKRIDGSISDHVKKVDDKFVKFERSQSDLTTKVSDLTKKNENISSKFDQLGELKTQFDSKIKTWDSKVDKVEIKEINTLINNEIKKIQTNIDDILEKNEERFSNMKSKTQDSNKEVSPKDFITKEEFTVLDINFSKLSEIVENMQGEIFEHQHEETSQLEQLEMSMKTLKTQVEAMTRDSRQSEPSSTPSSGISDLVRTIQNTIGSLETNMNALKADVPSRKEFDKILDLIEEKNIQMDRSTPGHGIALTSIDKQRRGWEEAREKAEEMAQIFDSLIITNDRPYVSCGLDTEVTEPGLLEFSQFELINKVAFDTDTNQFSLLEPGVYLLQMSGSVQGGSLIAKLVSEDVAVDFMILEAGKNGSFKSRSTIFTIEDDDQTAENLLVELVAHGEGEVKLESDFSFLMYKISEVSTADQLEC